MQIDCMSITQPEGLWSANFLFRSHPSELASQQSTQAQDPVARDKRDEDLVPK